MLQEFSKNSASTSDLISISHEASSNKPQPVARSIVDTTNYTIYSFSDALYDIESAAMAKLLQYGPKVDIGRSRLNQRSSFAWLE